MENPVNGANDHDVEVEPNGVEDGAVDVDAQVFHAYFLSTYLLRLVWSMMFVIFN